MSSIAFADVVHQLIEFDTEDPAEKLVLELIGTPWFQRLRDVSQTATTRLVYMFSEHSRFGHCVGVAYLAKLLTDKLAVQFGSDVHHYRAPVLAAALLHDLGHLAPGSHGAFKIWFPSIPDEHEALSTRIIEEDPLIRGLLEAAGPDVLPQTCAILGESPAVPPWTWEIISGGGWNVDRGNWCVVDSHLAGVSYGKYNISALTEAMLLTDDKHLALSESRLDAMMHFAISRHAMYRQIYQHRVLLAADTLNQAIVQRARDLGGAIPFADDVMRQVLAASAPGDLDLHSIFWMRESWWRYHLSRWTECDDKILADLSSRLLNRRLFKTVRVRDSDASDSIRGNSQIDDLFGSGSLLAAARDAVQKAGFDPRYYLHELSTSSVHLGDSRQAMLVRLDDGRLEALPRAEPLYQSLVRESDSINRRWIALPAEAKRILGRTR